MKMLTCGIWFTLVFLLSPVLLAGQLTSTESDHFFIRHITVAENGRVIETCREGHCQTYPFPNSSLYGFDGSNHSWNELFTRCAGFEDSNSFFKFVEVFSFIATFWNAGVIVNSTKSVQLLTRQMGRLRGAAKVIIDLSVHSSLTTTAVSLNGSSSIYPEVSRDEVERGLLYFNWLLDESKGTLYFDEEMIEAINELLFQCTDNFSRYFISTQNSKCLSECHTSPRVESIENRDSINHELLTDYPNPFNDQELEDLSQYLLELSN